MKGRSDPQPNPDQAAERFGHHSEHESFRIGVGELGQHRSAGLIRAPEVASEHPGNVVPILQQNRPIEPHLAADRFYGFRIRRLAGHQACRITGQDGEEREADREHPDQHRDEHQDAPNQISRHMVGDQASGLTMTTSATRRDGTCACPSAMDGSS